MDGVATMLQVGIADVGVLVGGTFLDDLVGRQQRCALIDVADTDQRVADVDRVDVPDRIGIGIDDKTGGITYGARPDDRPEQMGALTGPQTAMVWPKSS